MAKQHPLTVIMPPGALGAQVDDPPLEAALRRIAVAASRSDEWAEKYGTAFKNAVFVMHPFCWCDRADCPWCARCACPVSATHYLIDGHEVSWRAWMAYYDERVGPKPGPGQSWAEHNRRADAVNTHRSIRADHVCDFCQARGVFAAHGAEPGLGAPHFWHKPSGLKVWWYKYIGRDMVVRGEASPAALDRIVAECVASLPEA